MQSHNYPKMPGSNNHHFSALCVTCTDQDWLLQCTIISIFNTQLNLSFDPSIICYFEIPLYLFTATLNFITTNNVMN